MDQRRSRRHGHRQPGIGHIVDDAGEQGSDVNRPALLGAHLVTGESQRRSGLGMFAIRIGLGIAPALFSLAMLLTYSMVMGIVYAALNS